MKPYNIKALILKVALPLTLIYFTLFTKWWYVLPVDTPNTMMSGFPLISMSDGWHTSFSYQIFILEFIINFLISLLFWFLITLFFHRVVKIKFHKIFLNFLKVMTVIIGLWLIVFLSSFEIVYKTKKNFDYEVLTTGQKWIWQKRLSYEELIKKVDQSNQ